MAFPFIYGIFFTKITSLCNYYVQTQNIYPTFEKNQFNQYKIYQIMEGYCVKCKSKREIKDGNEVTMKNGRKAMKGSCPTCGTGMFRILGKA